MVFQKTEEYIITHYYIFLISGYFLRIITDFRPGIFILLLNFTLLGCHIMANFHSRKLKVSIVTLFAICSILSFIMFLGNDQSLGIYVNSAIYVISPMVCFLSTPMLEENKEKFYVNYLIAITANNLFGIICFYLKPDFYVNYVYRTSSAAYEQVMHHAGVGRLITLFGSIETGVLAGVGVMTGILLLQRRKKDMLIILSVIINFTAVIISQQRGPFFAFLLLIAFTFAYSSVKRKRLINPIIPILIVVVFIITLFFLYTYKPIVFGWIVQRLTNPSSAINDRYDYQWDVVKSNKNFLQWILGKGLGNVGLFIQDTSITLRIWDNMYFNMMAEIGLLGFALFVSVLARSTIKMFSNVECNLLYFAPVFAIAFQGMGTSMNYYPQIMGMFWFSAGCLFHCAQFDTPVDNHNIKELELEH